MAKGEKELATQRGKGGDKNTKCNRYWFLNLNSVPALLGALLILSHRSPDINPMKPELSQFADEKQTESDLPEAMQMAGMKSCGWTPSLELSQCTIIRSLSPSPSSWPHWGHQGPSLGKREVPSPVSSLFSYPPADGDVFPAAVEVPLNSCVTLCSEIRGQPVGMRPYDWSQHPESKNLCRCFAVILAPKLPT